CCTCTPGQRTRTAATKCSEGSTAQTASADNRLTSSAVSAPGPQPTSSTRRPAATPANSANRGASGIEYRPMNRSYSSAPTLKLLLDDDLPLHPRVQPAHEVEGRPGSGRDGDRDALVARRSALRFGDADAVTRYVEARLARVDDPVRDRVRRPGRLARMRDVLG